MTTTTLTVFGHKSLRRNNETCIYGPGTWIRVIVEGEEEEKRRKQHLPPTTFLQMTRWLLLCQNIQLHSSHLSRKDKIISPLREKERKINTSKPNYSNYKVIHKLLWAIKAPREIIFQDKHIYNVKGIMMCIRIKEMRSMPLPEKTNPLNGCYVKYSSV